MAECLSGKACNFCKALPDLTHDPRGSRHRPFGGRPNPELRVPNSRRLGPDLARHECAIRGHCLPGFGSASPRLEIATRVRLSQLY